MVIMIFMMLSVCKLCNDQCDFSVAKYSNGGLQCLYRGEMNILIKIKIYCIGNWEVYIVG